MDPIPARIRIRVIPIPALLDVIPAPDPDPQKSGIVTPLASSNYHVAKVEQPLALRSRREQIITWMPIAHSSIIFCNHHSIDLTISENSAYIHAHNFAT